MAGEIGHVVYAARVLTFLGDKVEEPTYWVGTLFPDIRHLGLVTRHFTHPEGVSLSSLVGKNDFMTGMRVHAWIDSTREKFFSTQHMKEMLPWHPFVPHALKLYEDELLYEHFDDWNLIHRLLNKVHEDELYFVHTPERVQQWHTILQKYIKHTPNPKSRLELSTGIGLSPESADEVNSVVERLRKDKKTKQLLEGFWNHLDLALA